MTLQSTKSMIQETLQDKQQTVLKIDKLQRKEGKTYTLRDLRCLSTNAMYELHFQF